MCRLFVILLLFESFSVCAQKNISSQFSLYFDKPDVLRKAGVKSVRCIFKDSRKLIWIGTENGLFRYDGTNCVYIRHKPGDSSSIPNNTVVSIAEDKKGNIWLGTLGGIGCMNPNDFKCKIYRAELHNLPAGDFDNKILIGPAGEIWTGNTDGLYLFNSQKNCFEIFWKNVISLKTVSAYITCLTYWKPDTLALGTFTDLVLVNTKDHGFKRISLLNKDVLITHILKDAQQHLWIGTWGDGCIISNNTCTTFQQYKWEKDLPSNVDNIVTSLVETNESSNDNIWIGSDSLILKIPLKDDLTGLHKVSSYSISHASNKDPGNISCMMADDENYIWTGGNEVSRFSSGRSLFNTVAELTNGHVQNIQSIDVNGKKYTAISMWHGARGIFFIDENGNRKIINSVAPGDPYGVDISGIAVDKQNRIWLSSLAGIFILDDRFNIVKNLGTKQKKNNILIHNDTVWVASYKSGIDLYDLNFKKIKHFIDHDGSGLLDNLVQTFFQDSKGNIWVCGNAFFYKYVEGSFQKYDFSVEHVGYSPVDVAEMPDGNLLIATETGLIHFDTKTENFYRITTPLLDKEDVILSVAVDKKGDAWYLTSNHLVHYEPVTKKFTLFGEEDGLLADRLQMIRTFDGEKIFLGEEGRLLQFDPSDWEKKTTPPQIFIHAVQVNDSVLQSAAPVKDLHLSYDQNKIYFEFDGITYTKPEQNQYAYQLTGIDNNWITTNKNFVSYANLPPGNYRFRVKAANYAGEWSNEYVIPVSITPPFWKTWWFITLMVLAVGAVFFLIVRYVSQRNLRERILRLEKEQAVEKERNRIARDMHDDLGSGLTKIAILSEVAKTQLQQREQAATQLQKISESSRELVDNLQDIIWVLNPRNDSLENLAAYIREYALKFFDSTDIVVTFCYPQQIPSVKLSEEQRRNIFLVMKETLNNIAKHANCSSVAITLAIKKQQLTVEIKDDGKGFNVASVRQFANGLNNMTQRMEQVNGTYEINSNEGAGSKTKLSMFL